jgi:hypothetical protein
MNRRDLSTLLLASSATSALAMKSVQAQTCAAPCYATTSAEISAGVTPVNASYPQGDIRRYGADPTGSADSTAAIQNALNVGQAVYIAPGQYTIRTALTNSVSTRRIYGDGPTISVLCPQGAIDTLVNTAALSCVLMDNFGIMGGPTTRDGITQSPSVPLYESRFENINVWCGGRAFYLPGEFNTQLINCQGSSYNANVFELCGGNSTLLQGCYAHQVPAGCYGYRIYATAHLDSCTGIDSPTGGDWGLFGAATSSGDPVTASLRWHRGPFRRRGDGHFRRAAAVHRLSRVGDGKRLGDFQRGEQDGRRLRDSKQQPRERCVGRLDAAPNGDLTAVRISPGNGTRQTTSCDCAAAPDLSDSAPGPHCVRSGATA